MDANVQKFTIDVKGETTGEVWKGLFKAKVRLSHRDQLKQDEIRRELLGTNPENASPRAKNQAEIFSALAVHILEAPDWWHRAGEGFDLEDDSVIGAVYDGIIKARNDAQEALIKEAEEAKKSLKSE